MKAARGPVRMPWLANAPELIVCDVGFRLGEYSAAALPIVRDGRLRVDVNVASYFRYVCRRRGGSPGSMKAAAYVLRDWMAYLRSRGLYWTEVTDDVVAGWCNAQRDAGAFRGHRDSRGVRRLTAKVSRVYDFYYVAEHELALVSGLVQRAGIVTSEQLGCGLTVVDAPLKGRRGRRNGWSPGFKVDGAHPGKGAGRPTPDAEAVEKVRLAGLDRPSVFAAATHGLILDLMSRSAPRAGGVAGMTLDGLSQALAAEDILDGRGLRPVPWRLAEIAGSYGARRAVLAAIEALAARARSSLYVPVVEKGGKGRELEVPHGLFVQILEYVWDQRAELVGRRFRGKLIADPGALWLSLKTRRALTAGAIGNMAKAAFKEARSEGSGHRLRAYAIEDKLVRTLRQGRSRAGRSHSVDDALFTTAQFSGHVDTRSLTNYVNKIRRRENEIDQFVIGVADRNVADQLRALVKRIEEADGGATQALLDLMESLDLRPLAEIGSPDDARRPIGIPGPRRT